MKMTRAYLWELTSAYAARAFLVAGDVLIVLIQDPDGAATEARPVQASSHRAAVRMALDMTENAEREGLTLTMKPCMVEIPAYEPAHLFSAQMLTVGTALAPRVEAVLSRIVSEGITLDGEPDL